MSPVWFIPVVGNILVPLAGVVHARRTRSRFFFSTGLIFWIVLQTLFFYRIFFHHPLPEKLLPTFFHPSGSPHTGFHRVRQADRWHRPVRPYPLLLWAIPIPLLVGADADAAPSPLLPLVVGLLVPSSGNGNRQYPDVPRDRYALLLRNRLGRFRSSGRCHRDVDGADHSGHGPKPDLCRRSAAGDAIIGGG